MVISPLSAIMVDQKEKFSGVGWNVEFVGEAQMHKTAVGRAISGEAHLVYISPENIINNSIYRRMLLTPAYRENLVGVAVDEAHCVKTW